MKISSFVIICLIVAALMTSGVSHAQQYVFGLTQKGGYYDKGTPYQIITSGKQFVAFAEFDGQGGDRPGNGAGFIQATGTGHYLSFLTQYGDQNQNYGSYLSIDPTQGVLVGPLYRFDVGSNGTNPAGKLVVCADGSAAGMTSANGPSNDGTVFATFGNNLETLVAFNGAERGRSPKGSLILGPEGKLFGMTELGGVNDKGVVFSVQKYGFYGNFKKLIDFAGVTNGSNPTGSLLLAADAKLYGMTRDGGVNGLGVVFSINTDGTGFTKLFDFNGAASGSHPNGSLVQYSNGKLYGMTASGGANGFGTIFTITTAGSFTKVLDFNGSNGKSPLGDLLVEPAGLDLYGVTYSGGANDLGVFFKLSNGNTYSKLYDFEVTTGSNPVGSLLMIRPNATFSFPDIPEKNTLSSSFTPEVNSPDVPFYFISSDTTIAVVKNNQVTIKSAGACNITAYQLGSNAFNTQIITRLLIVRKAPQTITFPLIASKTFGDAPFVISATSSSGLPLSFTSFSSDVLSYDGSLWTVKASGEIVVTALQSGNDTYDPAPAVSQKIVVNRADQVITFNPPASVPCCQGLTLNATATSHEDVAFRSSDPDVIFVSGQYAYPVKAGTADITAYHPGNAQYKPAEITRSVTIAKSTQALAFTVNSTTINVGGSSNLTGFGASSGLPLVYTSSPAGVAVVIEPLIIAVGTGTTTITASQPGNNSFFPAPSVSLFITVTGPLTPPANNTITWPDPGNKYVNSAPFNLIAVASTGLPVTYSSSNPAVAEVSGNVVTVKTVGSTTLTASQSGNTNFPPATSISKVINVLKANQSISMVPMGDVKFGTSPLAMRKFSSAGLPITYTSTNASIASVDNYVLHYNDGGYVRIIASQPGNDFFIQASESEAFTVSILYPNLVFDVLPDKTFGDPSFELTATTSSGLSVDYASSDLGIATISGNQLTVHSAGTVTITASVGGPGYARTTLTQSLVVHKASQTITFNGLTAKKFGDPSFTVSGSSSANLPVVFTSATPAVAKVSGNIVKIVGNGTATIVASQPGNAGFEAAQSVQQSFTVADVGNTYSMVGTAVTGGPNYSGVVFGVNSDGSNFALKKQYPTQSLPFFQANFIKASDGRLYGCSAFGGKNNGGSIMRLEADGSGRTSLFDLDYLTSGSYVSAALIYANDSYLYGVAPRGGANKSGTIFRIKTDGSAFTVIHAFSEGIPGGGVTQANDGKLYGMLQNGGLFNNGVVYRLDPDGGNFETVFYFNDLLHDKTGVVPSGELRQAPDGFLYGVTDYGGPMGLGTLFKIKTDGTGFKRLIAFDGVNVGSMPGPVHVGSDGKLYGMTQRGGANRDGIVYSINADGSNFVKLIDFDESKGTFPLGELTEGSDGQLYGSTTQGGANSFGVVFRVHKDGSGFQVIHDMELSAFGTFYGALVESTPGNFFGTTFQGGPNNGGVMFKVTSSGVFTVIDDFVQDVGAPISIVTDAASEFYYGLTASGGANGNGTIFRLKGDDSTYESLFDIPMGVTVERLFYIATGHLWCVASNAAGAAVIFRLKTDGTEVQTLSPQGTSTYGQILWLVEGSDGWIFGTLSGVSYAASIFKIKNDGTGFTKVVDLPQEVGEISATRLTRASDGNFYGAGTYGGVIYRVTEAGTYSTVITLPNNSGYAPILQELDGGSLGIFMISGAFYTVEKDGSGLTKVSDPPSFSGRVRDVAQTIDGWIHVVSDIGGSNDDGVLYKMTGDGRAVIVHDFSRGDGISPSSIVFKRTAQTFTFDPLPKMRVSDLPLTPVISTSSGVPAVLVSSNLSVAIIENGKIKAIGSGTTTITASLPANANYFAAPDIQQQLVVSGPQTIIFANPGDHALGSAPFALTATASSGLAVTYSSTSTGISIANEVVTLLQAGPVTIDANQAGNDDIAPAPTVSVSFCVNPSQPQITVSGPGSGPTLQSSTATGNQWFFNHSAITGATAATFAPVADGEYSVNVNVNGCSSTMSDLVEITVTITTGLDPGFVIRVFPNPTHDFVRVELSNSVPLSVPLQLIDATGTTMKEVRISDGNPVQLDLTTLAKGLYLIKVQANNAAYLWRVVKE